MLNADLIIEAIQLITSPEERTVSTGEDGHQKAPCFDATLQRNLEKLDTLMTSERYASLQEAFMGDMTSGLPQEPRASGDTNTVEYRHSTYSGQTYTDQADIRWIFVEKCLKLLYFLNRSLKLTVNKMKTDEEERRSHHGVPSREVEPSAESLLSVGQQKIILAVVQFIICLGVCPNLQPGVGIPLEKRSGYGRIFSDHAADEKVCDVDKDYRLLRCVHVLTDCVEQPAISTLILSRHLSDILATLLQICFRRRVSVKLNSSMDSQALEHHHGLPELERDCDKNESGHKDKNICLTPASIVNPVLNQKQRTCLAESHISDGMLQQEPSDKGPVLSGESVAETHMTKQSEIDKQREQCSTVLMEGRKFCEDTLHDLMKRVYPPLLVRELLLLQGGPGPRIAKKACSSSAPSSQSPVLACAPGWLRKICGQLLSDILVRPKGLFSVLRGMLQDSGIGPVGTVSESQTSDWRKCDAVARVIASCPLQSSSVEDYYRRVCPQVLDLLHYPDAQLARQYQRVACGTIATMAAQQGELTLTYILKPLLKPLLTCTTAMPRPSLAQLHPHLARVGIDRSLNSDYQFPENYTEGTGSSSHEEGSVLVTEEDLSACLVDVHKVFVSSVASQATMLTRLNPVIHVLFQLYCATHAGVSHVRKVLHDILQNFLKQNEKALSVECLRSFIFNHMTCNLIDKGFKAVRSYIQFQASAEGGVCVAITRSEVPQSEIDGVRITCVVDLLQDLQTEGLAGEFFLDRMQALTQMISKETEETDVIISISSTLHEDGQLGMVQSFVQQLTNLNLLAAMCDALGPSCLKDNILIIEFAKVTLERAVKVCSRTSDEMSVLFESETITMAMALLVALISGAVKISSDDKNRMKELLPLLEDIEKSHPDYAIQTMASDLRIAIATHGAVLTDLIASKAGYFHGTAETTERKPEIKITTDHTADNRPKIEVLTEQTYASSSPSLSSSVSSSSGEKSNAKSDVLSKEDVSVNVDQSDPETGSSGDERKQVKLTSVNHDVKASQKTMTSEVMNNDVKTSAFDQALEEIKDPLLPIRAHGLRVIAKLLQAKDPESLEQGERILEICLENMDDSDSYLYLAAVNGLVALADRFPSKIIPKLTAEFTHSRETSGDELRMKVGECLVKATQTLGDLSPAYRDQLLPAFLVAARDEEPFIRASSLSNLAEICRLLRFSLGQYVHELFECCSSLLKHDRDTEVRKAAALMITMLLQGLGSDIFKVLEDILKDLYKLLKLSSSTETDSTVLFHVDLALTELDTLMRASLFPKQTLSKKITVLHPS